MDLTSAICHKNDYILGKILQVGLWYTYIYVLYLYTKFCNKSKAVF